MFPENCPGRQRHKTEKRGGVGRKDADDAGRVRGRKIEVGGRNGVHGAEDLAVFVGPSGIANKAVNGSFHLASGFLFGLAGGGDDLLQEALRAAFEHFRSAVENLPFEIGGRISPAGECAAGRDDRIAEVFG